MKASQQKIVRLCKFAEIEFEVCKKAKQFFATAFADVDLREALKNPLEHFQLIINQFINIVTNMRRTFSANGETMSRILVQKTITASIA